MRLLADENFPRKLVELLRKAGYEVLWARTELPGATDVALLEKAEAEGRILLTLDKDFWQLALQRPAGLDRAGVILFRANPPVRANLEPLVLSALTARREWDGFVSLVNRDGIEMLPARRKLKT